MDGGLVLAGFALLLGIAPAIVDQWSGFLAVMPLQVPGWQFGQNVACRVGSLILWGIVAAGLANGKSSAVGNAAAVMCFLAGGWFALFGGDRLVGSMRQRRVVAAGRRGKAFGFPGTIHPFPATFQGESWFRVLPGGLTVLSDASLPEQFGRRLIGEVDPASLRKALWSNAPGHQFWWSVTLTRRPGGGEDLVISAAKEHIQAVIGAAPFSR